MPNIKAEVKKTKQKDLRNADIQLCNSTNKKQCPLNRQWLTESIFYPANITANIPGYKEKNYLSVSETTFKVCNSNHKKLFPKQHHKNDNRTEHPK